MATVFGIDHKYVAASTIAVSVGIAIYTTYRLTRQRFDTSNAYYETKKLLNEYLLFHYGQPKDVLVFEDFAPSDSLDFPKRCADLCIKHYPNSPGVPRRALDIGCAVGRSTFELARIVDEAIGIDFSKTFIDACNTLKKDGSMGYTITSEGCLFTEHTAVIPKDIDRQKVRFLQGDACNLPKDLGKFGIVLAANLICRLHHPLDFLRRIESFITPGGILVITAPYTWMEQFTDKSLWLGGYTDKNGKPVTGFDGLKKELSPWFDLVEDRNLPFLIRETTRKHQWTVAHATVWARK